MRATLPTKSKAVRTGIPELVEIHTGQDVGAFYLSDLVNKNAIEHLLPLEFEIYLLLATSGK